MSEKEMDSARAIADMLSSLPDGKKEFLLGYGEGVAAMADRKRPVRPTSDKKEG